jgi:ABC-type nitrate/sulfonate/bicarbonate transport system substrate-binding protein
MNRFAAIAIALAFGAAALPGAARAESVTIGKAVPFAWTFLPADVGLEAGIWKKHGFDEVKISGFGGDAKLQQALLSKDIDFGLASGPGMAFNAKGGGGMGVVAYYGAPRNLAIAVPFDSKITKISELKGKKIGVTTAGSLTDWLTQRLSQHLGWGTSGITPVALGGLDTSLAGLKTGQVDGLALATEVTYGMEEKKQLKLLYNFAELVPEFITHVVYARKDLIASNPDKVKRFVAGFMETVAYMRANKAKVVETSVRVLHMSPEIGSRVYDEEIKEFTKDGRFNPKAVAILAESYEGMGLLDRKPANDEIFTEKFLP